MLRTTAAGNDSGRYTIGSPTLGVPATVVDDTSMNFLQEELVNLVEGAGLTLAASETQVLAAVIALVGAGGTKISASHTIANNTVDQVIASVVFDKTITRAATILMNAHRRTDTQDVSSTIRVVCQYNPEDDTWAVAWDYDFDDPGLTFNITSTGQLRVTSNDLTGTSYSGTLRISHIQKLDVA